MDVTAEPPGDCSATTANGAAAPPQMEMAKASLAVIALLLASGAIAVTCCRSLYADGAYYLLRIITTGGVMRAWPSRLFADYLMDYPVVVALDWGVRSLRTLTILFTASLLYIPLLAYSAAIWIAKDDRWLWTATLVVLTLCYFPTSFFMVGEFHLLYALFWLGFVILLTGKGDRPAGALGIVAVAFMLIRSYDLSVVLCPALAGLCAWRIAVAADRRATLLLAAAGGLLLIAAWSGLQGVIAPTDPVNKAQFLAHTEDILQSRLVLEDLPLVVVAVAAAFAPKGRLTVVLGGIFAIVLAGRAIDAFGHHERLVFGSPYDLRGKAFVLLVAISLIVLVRRCTGWPRQGGRFAVWPLLLLPVWAAGATVFDTADWARYLRALCTELRSEGDAHAAEFLAQPLAKKFNWGWTGPTMSVLLRPAGSSRIIVFHPPNKPSFEPFDPTSGVPDITVFGAAGPICREPEGR